MRIERPYGYNFEKRNNSKLWLDKNENIDPLFQKTIKSIINNVSTSANFYPENKDIYSLLAKIEKINKTNIIFTHGSDGGIFNVFKLLINKGDRVLVTNPTFAMYDIYCQIFGAKKVSVPYEFHSNQLSLNYDKILQNIKKYQIKLLCLPNPDSPSGIYHDKEFIIKALGLLNKNNSFLLIDEAYYPFYPNTWMQEIKKFNNLIILRSFSKSFGIAGLRIGYVASNKNIIQQLNQIKPMYEVNSLSLDVAYFLLKYIDKVYLSVRRLNKGKIYFENYFKKKNYRVLDTKGNFSHIEIPELERKKFKKYCYFRYFNTGPLSGFSRFTSTTVKNFQILLIQVYGKK